LSQFKTNGFDEFVERSSYSEDDKKTLRAIFQKGGITV